MEVAGDSEVGCRACVDNVRVHVCFGDKNTQAGELLASELAGYV